MFHCNRSQMNLQLATKCLNATEEQATFRNVIDVL